MPTLRSRAALPLCLLVLLLALPWHARADPLTPWPGERTAPGTLQLVPLLYVSGDASAFSPLLYASTGFGESWDVYVGVWGLLSADIKGLDLLDVFPRYHLTPETALVLRAQLARGGELTLGAEVHSNLAWGPVSLMINAGVRPALNLPVGSLGSGGLFAILAPEYHFNELFSVYCELNPSVYAQLPYEGGASLGAELAILPGISFSLDAEETHQFSVGAEFALRRGEAFTLANSVTFGAWYATSFDLGTHPKEKEEEEAPAPVASRRFSRTGMGEGRRW